VTGDAIFVPGTLCDARIFADLRARLPDVRGKVADLAAHESVEAAAVSALADAPARFVAVGFSLGGFVALEMLRVAPERLRGVVLIAGNAHPDAPENAATRTAEVERARDVGMATFVTEWYPNDASRQLIIAMAAALGHDAHARHAAMNIARPDLRDVAHGSAVPLLVIAGERDPLCSRERYEIAAAGPMAQLRVISGAGHYLPIEAPDAVAAAIRDWEVPA
jgi:pimeloyl-ACP methyl ester carboxylesterase